MRKARYARCMRKNAPGARRRPAHHLTLPKIKALPNLGTLRAFLSTLPRGERQARSGVSLLSTIAGSLALSGTLLRHGSLALSGTLLRHGSLYPNGTLTRHGSLFHSGTLLPGCDSLSCHTLMFPV